MSEDPIRIYRRFIVTCAEAHAHESFWETPLTAAEEAFIRAHARLPRVLVAGCGPGRGIQTLLDLGARVTALDREPAMAALARSRLEGQPVEVTTGEIRDLPRLFGESAFDTVLCWGLVTGALFLPGEDRNGCLEAMRRALAPGGVLLLDFMLCRSDGELGEIRTLDYRLPGGRTIPAVSYWPTLGEARIELGRAGLRGTFVPLHHGAGEPRFAVVCEPLARYEARAAIRRTVPG